MSTSKLSDSELDALDAIYLRPSATGEIITQLVPDGQAHVLGMRCGDILTRYAGQAITEHASLNSLREGTTSGPVEVVADRGGVVLKFAAEPGRLGVYTDYVRKGIDSGLRAPRIIPLPDSTDDPLDFSSLQRAPLEVWHRMYFGDDNAHVGFAHFKLALNGETLDSTYDWCFYSPWGLIGDFTQSKLKLTQGVPCLLASNSESNDGSYVSTGIREVDGAGHAAWVLRRKENGTEENLSLPFPEPPFIGALQLQLGGFLKRRMGACRHYQFLNGKEWVRLAARVEAAESIEFPDGTQHDAWLVRQHTPGGPEIKVWFGADGCPLRIEFGPAYGGAWTARASKAEAIQGLNPAIRVRGA